MAKVRQICIALAALALLAMAGGGVGESGRAASAQTEHHAGLVIQFADGSTRSYCIPFSGDSITGLDLLLKTGLDVKVEVYGSLGTWICKIGPDGCNYPGEQCVCQSYGPGGVYWAYQHLKNGKWVSSSLGAGAYKVHDGDVDGWAWSSGKGPDTVPSFGSVCAAVIAPTAAPTKEPTAPPTITATSRRPTATPARRPTFTATPRPRATATATATAATNSRPLPVQTQPTATLAPPAETPTPTATVAPTQTATPTSTPVPGDTPVPTQTPTQVVVTPTTTPAPPSGGSSSGESMARMVAIAAGLISALGFAVWRIAAGARSKGSA